MKNVCRTVTAWKTEEEDLVSRYDGPDARPFLTRLKAVKEFKRTATAHWRVAWLSHKYRGHNFLPLRDSRRAAGPCLGAGRKRFLTACGGAPDHIMWLVAFLKANPTAATFGDIDPPVPPPVSLLQQAAFHRLFDD